MKNKALVTCCLALVFFVLVLGLQGRNLLSQIFYTLLVITPVVVGWFSVREYGLDSVHGRFFGLMLLGIGLWSTGEAVWFLFEWVLGIDPFPSVADVFYLMGYVPMLMAMKNEITHVGLTSFLKHLGMTVLLGIIFVLVSSVVMYTGIYQVYSQDAGFWINAISIAYGVGDLLLVASALLLVNLLHAYKGGKLVGVLSFMTFGFVLTLVADIGFNMNYVDYSDGIRPFIYLDILWVAAYLCFLVAYSYAYDLAKAIRLQVTRVITYAR